MSKAKNKLEMKLPSADDLFSTEEQRQDAKLTKVYDISIAEIDDFPEHPFKVKDDEDMQNLVESIRERGVITPATVRKKEDGRYEIVSGHRRKHACELLGLETLRCEVVELTKEEATVMMVESNFQRSVILPSEKAFAYKMRHEALAHQGKRDPTSGQIVPKSDANRSSAQIGEQTGESYKTVQRYIRLTNLIPELLDMMDEGKIAFSVGVELSFLDEALQRAVLDACALNDNTPSYAQAVRMHKAHAAGTLDHDGVGAILCEEKANQREKVTIPLDRLKGKIPSGYDGRQMQEYVLKALEYYHRYLQRRKESER